MAVLLDLIGQVRRFKTLQQLSLKVELQSLTVSLKTDQWLQLINNHATILKGVCKAQELIIVQKEMEAGLTQVGESWTGIITV